MSDDDELTDLEYRELKALLAKAAARDPEWRAKMDQLRVRIIEEGKTPEYADATIRMLSGRRRTRERSRARRALSAADHEAEIRRILAEANDDDT